MQQPREQPSAKSSQAGRPDLDDLAKVGERAGQPVDLVDDDDVDSPRLDLDQMKEQLAAGLSEWQIAAFVENDEVHAREIFGDPPLPAGAGFARQPVDEVGDCVEAA